VRDRPPAGFVVTRFLHGDLRYSVKSAGSPTATGGPKKAKDETDDDRPGERSRPRFVLRFLVRPDGTDSAATGLPLPAPCPGTAGAEPSTDEGGHTPCSGGGSLPERAVRRPPHVATSTLRARPRGPLECSGSMGIGPRCRVPVERRERAEMDPHSGTPTLAAVRPWREPLRWCSSSLGRLLVFLPAGRADHGVLGPGHDGDPRSSARAPPSTAA